MVLHSFYWRHPAGNVKVTGDFDEWKGTLDMQKTADGTFVKVVDLPADSKVFYKFVVDGQWLVDHESQTEGEGVTQNNYILTESEPATATASRAGDAEALPTLGAGAAYTDPSATAAAATGAASQTAAPAAATAAAPAASSSSFNPSEVPAISGTGTAKAEPQSSSTATASTGSSIVDRAQASIPSSGDLEKKADELVAGASAAVAAGLAAGAAALGLSFGGSEKKDVKEATSTTDKVAADKAVAVPAPSVAKSAEVPASTASKVAAVSQTSTLEQAAVQAATLAATNAHNAAGLGGLTGAAPVGKSLVDAGSVGFTSVGTAINKELGIVGSSKLVQGLDEAKPVEETRTAEIESTIGASSQILSTTNGAPKVQKLGEHAVLAEVTVGGQALGTAVVTDSTITNAADLNIPPQAAEHLDRDVPPPTLTSQGINSTTAGVTPSASAPAQVVAPTATASAAPADLAPPIDAAQLAPSGSTLTTIAPAAVAAVPAPVASVADKSLTSASTNGATAAAASAPTASSAAAASPAVVTPAAQGQAVPAPASTITATATNTTAPVTKVASGPKPAKQSSSESRTEKPKKKNGLLRRMKSMFKSKD